MAPGVSLAYCAMRHSTGDITLSVGDWIWAAVDIVSLAVPVSQFAKDPINKSILRGLDWSVNAISIEASGSGLWKEVRQDKIIWKIAEKEGIVSKDGTIDLQTPGFRQKLKDITKFVNRMDLSRYEVNSKIEEEFPKEKHGKWYEIYYLNN